MKFNKFFLRHILYGPSDNEALFIGCFRLRDDMEVYVVDFLVKERVGTDVCRRVEERTWCAMRPLF